MDASISSALNSAKLFIALLSPDYIASNYCYEKEFEQALKRQEQCTLIIVPVIVEPCDWHSTPFQQFKALPKDGKAVSTWENKNTAFLDVVQNLRNLLSSPNAPQRIGSEVKAASGATARNYRVKKDFDSIEKLEFATKTFHEVKETIKRYMEEILQIDNIKAWTLMDSDREFESLLVNRNKVATEARLAVSIKSANATPSFYQNSEGAISYCITQNTRTASTKSFALAYDEYHLFWTDGNMFMSSRTKNEFSAKDIADTIWNEWLESVGIM